MQNCHAEPRSIHLCFAIQTYNSKAIYSTSANVYGAVFKGVENQRYAEIVKRRDQSLRCLQVRSIGTTYIHRWF
ncbi:hypothetical protein HZS_2833 [Henneguya salminicola]|nr:hypothetical protein HZS_2833 [Henneguya salminicola]